MPSPPVFLCKGEDALSRSEGLCKRCRGVNFERREEDCSMIDRTAKQESPLIPPLHGG